MAKGFIPQIWASLILSTLRSTSVGEFFVNHNYEGEIRQQGDTVKINILNDITVNDYKSGVNITYEDLDTDTQLLVIDQAKYCAIKIDDVEKVQSVGDLLGSATDNMAYKLSSAYDTHILDTIKATATASNDNMIGTDSAPIDASSPNDVVDAFIDIIVRANRYDVPNIDRRAVVTPEVAGAIMKSDKRSITPKFADFVRNGYIGNLYGVEVFSSNNLTKTEGRNDLILMTTPMITTVANQLLNMESLRSENSFKDLVRALHVYGAKTIYKHGVIGAYVKTSKD